MSATLAEVTSDLDALLDAHVRSEAIASLADADLIDVLQAAGEAQRRIEAIIAETTAAVEARSTGLREEKLTLRHGCRNTNELVQRVLLVDASTASRFVKAAKIVHRDSDFLTEGPLPARWPELREALLDGTIGLSGLLCATAPVAQAGDRIGAEDRLRADAELAAHARGCAGGEGEASAPLATPDDLNLLARVIVAYLDPDGAEPTDDRALRERFLTLGRAKNGVIPLRGALLPDAAGQLQRILDAFLSPRVDGPPQPGVLFRDSDDEDLEPSGDMRTRGQKQHDALAAALTIAARHDDMPSLGGAAPTLVVSVAADDFTSGSGWAQIEGVDAAVPVSVAAHTACAGGVQRVLFDPAGRIVSLGTSDRIFTAHQRRAISLRDGECVIPGCHVPATWCEIHHVHEHRDGGETHTDNGVALCWFHHRSLGSSGWDVRVVDGMPQVRGPAWWDRERRWRQPRRVRMLARRSGG